MSVGDETDHPHVLIFPPLLFLIGILIGVLATWLTPWRFHSRALIPVGIVLFLLAVAVARWGDSTMKAAGTNVRPDRPSTAIVDSGPFAYSRNPLYVCVLIMFVGVGLALRSPAFLFIAIPLALVLRYGVVAREEAYLEEKFGDGYRSYKGRVRRWI